MYGQPEIPRPELLKKADEDFIRKATEGLGSRERASDAWFAQGEEYTRQGNFDYAMRRYNQSWLLSPTNFKPHWGFGRVMAEQGKIDESIKHLETAKQLIGDELQKPALLADLGAVYSVKAETTHDSNEKARYFVLANENFKESVRLDPGHGNSWRQWAMALFRQGDYRGAWEKVKEARARKAKPLPAAFLRDLQQKMPEPK
jgi:tetratricopeptide (TPR) repeat protein